MGMKFLNKHQKHPKHGCMFLVVLMVFSRGHAGMIYFIEAVGHGRVKIGYAANPWKRLRQLQTGHPFELKMLACLPGELSDEQRLHKEFDSLRIGGEWFKLTPEIESLFELPELLPLTKRNHCLGDLRGMLMAPATESQIAINLFESNFCR